MDLFRESRDRLRRAKLHRNAFADHWNALIKDDALEFGIQHKSDRTGVITFRRRSSCGNDAAFELGEFFYQLRASLDCLAFTAVRQKTGDPVPDEDRIYFPIALTSASFKRQAEYLRPLPDQLNAWIKSVQPCFASECEDDAMRPLIELLRLLHECARKDRHRRLTLLTPVGSQLNVTIEFTPHVQIESLEGLSINLFEDEGVLANFRLAEHVPGLHVDMTGNLSVDVILDDVHLSGRQFAELPDNIGRAVEYAISRFEAYFPI